MKNFARILISISVIVAFSGCSSTIYTEIQRGNLPGVQEKLEKEKVNINSTDSPYVNGTPLHIASMFTKPEIVNYLIRKGADVNARDKYGNTPLHVVSLIYRDKSKYFEPLLIANYLVQNGADVNAKNSVGNTPLYNFVTNDREECIKFLISHGADTSVTNNEGKRPYDFIKNEHTRAIYLSAINNLNQKRKETQKAIAVASAEKNQRKAVEKFESQKDYQGLKNYTDKNPNAVYYISSKELRLAMTGPQGLKVGDIRKLLKEGRSETIVISLIKQSETPYKKFSLDEIDTLSSMGLSDNVIAAMINVTTQLLRDKKLKEQQDFFLMEQKKIAAQKSNRETATVYQNTNGETTDRYGNPIVEKVTDELVKQGVNRLMDHIF